MTFFFFEFKILAANRFAISSSLRSACLLIALVLIYLLYLNLYFELTFLILCKTWVHSFFLFILLVVFFRCWKLPFIVLFKIALFFFLSFSLVDMNKKFNETLINALLIYPLEMKQTQWIRNDQFEKNKKKLFRQINIGREWVEENKKKKKKQYFKNYKDYFLMWFFFSKF
jgi:hypothetical protein